MVACSLDASLCVPVHLSVDCTAASCQDTLFKAIDTSQRSYLPLSCSDAAQQVAAVDGLLQRLIPSHAHLFTCTIKPEPSSFFSVEVKDGRVLVEGTTGVDLSAGVNWFLKECLDSSVSWAATGGSQIDTSAFSRLPELEARGKSTVPRSFPFSYYQNVVTLSYSMAYWEWERWEQELDLMALQGINLPLAPVGMEAIWVETYKQLGLSAQELEDFFPGPSFIAWGRMGNLQGWGGPLPMGYIQKQEQLQVGRSARCLYGRLLTGPPDGAVVLWPRPACTLGRCAAEIYAHRMCAYLQ
jgi:alpha-N-acetylglucosaminidase